MKYLLMATTVIEAGAGVALLGFPSAMVKLLLSSQFDAPPSMTLVRMIGAVLIALGIACWLASRDTRKPCAKRTVIVMTAYNPCAALALGVVGMRVLSAGILLWPAVALHAAMGVWCIVCLKKNPLSV